MTGDPCQKEACAIQKCLQINNYVESACSKEMKTMLNCCIKWSTESGCCSGFQKELAAKSAAEKTK